MSSNWKAPNCSSRGNGPKSSQVCWGISGNRKPKAARGPRSCLRRPRAGEGRYSREDRPPPVLAGVLVPMNDVFHLGRVGKRTPGFGQERVAVTIAAATRRHRMALLDVVEAAGYHVGGHVLPAIF